MREGPNVTYPTMMLDHPGWLRGNDGRTRRVLRSAGAVWSVVCSPAPEGGHAVDMVRLVGDADGTPIIDTIDPKKLIGDATVCDPLRAVGPVARLRTSDVWEALGTAITRQVIKAATAKENYRRFCETYGEWYDTAAGPAWLFPSPETVLALSDEDFDALRMKFFRDGLRSAAEASLKAAEDWAGMTGEQLAAALQGVRRIGPWTAGATVADVTNDYSLYPFADLAVRTWAGKLAPSVDWPKPEPEFGRLWHAIAGAQLSEWTLLTLAWGVRHATGVAL
jgi:DNA-3-methyladenine glycosylase II